MGHLEVLGAYTQIQVAASAPTLYYYCSNHSGMGGQANSRFRYMGNVAFGTKNSWGKQDGSRYFCFWFWINFFCW